MGVVVVEGCLFVELGFNGFVVFDIVYIVFSVDGLVVEVVEVIEGDIIFVWFIRKIGSVMFCVGEFRI